MKQVFQMGLVLGALAAAGCGGDDSDNDGAGSAAQTGASNAGETKLARDSQPAKPGVTIKTAGSQFGKVLFSKSNRAIYYFDKESGRRPKCYGNCAEAWPPVLTSGKPQAAGAVKSNLLGTTQRGNKKQVTYDGHPLYFYVDDPKGEVLCHDIEEFGGLWLAVKPDGSSPPTS
jgi:predicted lipoprotein with Yx(FWY)xxD motif